MPSLTTIVWVRLLNVPLNLLHREVLADVGNSLDYFIKVDTKRLEKGIVIFAHKCVEIHLYRALSGKILLN